MGDQQWSPFSFLATLADNVAPLARPRSIFYIDGFNLFNGAVRRTPYKWLDLQTLCQRLRPTNDVILIRYFTSHVFGMAAQQSQARFLQALATRPLIRTEIGRFTKKPVTCGVGGCTHVGARNYTVVVEKRTDVSIGAHMVNDAARNRCDVLALISGDTDLVPAVKIVRLESPEKHVAVYVPIRRTEAQNIKERRSDELRKAAHKGGFVSPHLLPLCQFPDVITDANGNEIKKPATW